MAKSRPSVQVSGALDEIQTLVSRREIILQKSDSGTLDLPHLLTARQFSGREEGSTGAVLWLDGSNSFDPYRISEISRGLELDPELVLQEVYISRAFTCYQMMSLIFEKLGEAIGKFESELVVITGLTGLFSESDLKQEEALRAFDPVVKSLEDMKDPSLTIFLTSPDSEEDNGFASRLESVSDHVIGPEKEDRQAKKGTGTVLDNQGKTPSVQESSKVRPLEEFE